jgi:DNA-binding CsgD family transcriptional regulator
VVPSQQDLRRLRELKLELRAVDPAGAGWRTQLLPKLRELLHAEQAVAYGLIVLGERVVPEQLAVAGVSADRFGRELERIAHRHPRFGHFDPSRPEPDQRNRVLSRAELSRDRGRAPVQEALEALGLEQQDFLRALVCEGPELLCYVGFLRASAFGARERRLFGELLPELKRAVLLERELARAKMMQGALSVVLDQLDRPALLVDAHGRLLQANLPAHRWLEETGELAPSAMRAALEGGGGVLEVREVPGAGPKHFLLLAREDAAEPLARLSGVLGLTPRQSDVLERLLRGATNKEIGRELTCAVKTIELHVSAILRKARVKSRAELIATLSQARRPAA